MENKKMLLRKPELVSQPIDYYGCSLDKNFKLTGEAIIQAMDIDGVIEQHKTPFKPTMLYDKAFLFMEHKTLVNDNLCGMTKGQNDVYESIVDTMQAHKDDKGQNINLAVAVEVYHLPSETGFVKAHNCYVMRAYSNGHWVDLKTPLGLSELVIYFFYKAGLREPITKEEIDFLEKLRGEDDENRRIREILIAQIRSRSDKRRIA
jgi:hypothetical protein